MSSVIARGGGHVPVANQKKRPNTFVALLRCGSCRFAAFYFLSFSIALLDSRPASAGWILFGAAIWLLHSLGTELVNRLSDEVEDRVNRPERTALCDVVGFSRLRTISWAIWIAVGLIDVVWMIGQPNLAVAVLLLLALLAGVNYSYGVRFKRKRHLSLLALTFPFAGPFIVGWFVNHPISQLPQFGDEVMHRFGPFVVLVGLLIGSIASTKDITDARGDEGVGYLSVAVSLIRKNAVLAILGLISVPFVVLAVFVILGFLGNRFLYLMFCFPMSLLGALSICYAHTDEQRNSVKEAVYHYWFGLLSTSLYLYSPSNQTLSVIAGTAVYWIVASQYLHWSGGVKLSQVAAVWELTTSLFRRSVQRPTSG